MGTVLASDLSDSRCMYNLLNTNYYYFPSKTYFTYTQIMAYHPLNTTEKDVIRRLYHEGQTHTYISSLLHRSRSTISRYIQRLTTPPPEPVRTQAEINQSRHLLDIRAE